MLKMENDAQTFYVANSWEGGNVLMVSLSSTSHTRSTHDLSSGQEAAPSNALFEASGRLAI